MRSIDFNRKGSTIRVLSEDTKKLKYNWDRVIYIIFLTFVLLFLGYYFTNKIFFIRANGQVLFENVVVTTTYITYPSDNPMPTTSNAGLGTMHRMETLMLLVSCDTKPQTLSN